jgi:hypothetical protein
MNVEVPENPMRAFLAEVYIEKIMGDTETHQITKEAVNGGDGESRSLDYYIAYERVLNSMIRTVMIPLGKETKEKGITITSINGVSTVFADMLGYISYEIMTLSANEENT